MHTALQLILRKEINGFDSFIFTLEEVLSLNFKVVLFYCFPFLIDSKVSQGLFGFKYLTSTKPRILTCKS